MRLFARALCATALLCICSLWTYGQVPVSLIPTPMQQFFSSSGVPLAGGFVFTYVAGTSIPAPTYLDSTGTSLNTNPITLSSGGFAAIWIPSAPIDVAVFNSSMTQQYKVLNVTALPSTVTSLTAGFFQSTTTNPALSGFLRLASPDQICWRNNGNSADLCLNKNTSDQLFFGPSQFAFLNVTNQVFTGNQVFTNLFFSSGTAFNAEFQHSNTALRNYNFPDNSGTVCISTSCSVSAIAVDGVTITGVPVAGEVLTASSPTAAGWGLLGSIIDYDLYGGFQLFGVTPPVTETLQTLPIGAVQAANPIGSFIEGEIELSAVTYTGSAPIFQLDINGVQIGSNIPLATSTTYNIRFTIALSNGKAPQAVVNTMTSAGTTSSSFTGGLATIDGTAPVVIAYTVTTATAVSLTGQFVHVRVRN